MAVIGFAAAFRRYFPDLLGRPIAVALSGGADSVALLLLAHAAASSLDISVAAIHVHHHARGPEADADVVHCQELCDRLGIVLEVEHLDPEIPAGCSREAWWRRGRYRALERAARRLGCAAVATAHTRDDQAETVVLKLLRGSGARGAGGVRRRCGRVIRPLLDTPRATLREFLRMRGVTWREDPSNADPAYPRARVRHELLPALSAAFPGAAAHLAAFAAAAAADDECLAELLAERGVWPEVGRPVPLAAVAALPPALRARWVLELAARVPLAEPPCRAQLEEVDRMLDGAGPGAVDLGRRWVLRRRSRQLVLSPPRLDPFPPVAAPVPSCVTLPGGFVARLAAAAGDGGCHAASLHPRVLGRALSWRSVAAGERFGGKLAARQLAAAGVPAEWRRAWPVLVADGTMVWLPAVGVAQEWATAGAAGALVAGLEEPWERRDR